MKKVHHATRGPIAVKVHHSAEHREYRARLYYHGQAIPALDYYTDDKQDATDTAAKMLEWHAEETKTCHA